MESHGLPLDADIAAPEDPQERRERERRAAQHTRKAQRPRPLIDKDAFDAMQFFKNDRKASACNYLCALCPSLSACLILRSFWILRINACSTAAMGFVCQNHQSMQKDPSLVWPCQVQVLRFHCYWDDRMALYGDMRLFRLYYYLSDDTVEVVEVLRRNCGRDPFPHMLRRLRVPKCPEPVGALQPLLVFVQISNINLITSCRP